MSKGLVVDGLFGPKTEFAIRTAFVPSADLKRMLYEAEREIIRLKSELKEVRNGTTSDR